MWIKAEDREGEKRQLFNLDHALSITVAAGREPTDVDANEPNVSGIHRATGPHIYTVTAHFSDPKVEDVHLTGPKGSQEEAEAVLLRILESKGENIDLNN